MKVVFFQRRPVKFGNYSLENYFAGVRKHLPKDIEQSVFISKYESKGILPRIYNVFRAAGSQGDINHITGDEHYLNFLMPKGKTLLTILDCGFMNSPSKLKKVFLKFFWLTLPIKKAKYITTISSSTKTELLKYIDEDPDKIFVIPVFVNSHFTPHPQPFNKEKPQILQLGTAPNKNIFRLIGAIKDIKCHLVIVGKISEELSEKLSSNNIEFTNLKGLTDEEVLEQYINCDIVSLISTYEGFGMPIIEGNSVERPVITSNILSMPEVADNAACLVDPFDVESMKEGFLKIINDDDYRNQLIENGKTNKIRYQAQTIVNSYVELYKKIYNHK